MKKLFVLFIASFCCLSGFAQKKDVETLKKLNADWIASYVTRDTATMSRIFADDLVLTNPGGQAFHKKDMLKSAASPARAYLSAKVDTVSVRLFGNVGIIDATMTATLKGGKKTDTLRTCYMDVYEKRNGRWYAVAAHVTLLSLK